jgi:hypothetical protein
VSAGRAESTKILRKAQRQGLRIERTKGGHWKVTSPESGQFRIVSFSPRTTNMHNLKQSLRELGYED